MKTILRNKFSLCVCFLCGDACESFGALCGKIQFKKHAHISQIIKKQKENHWDTPARRNADHPAMIIVGANTHCAYREQAWKHNYLHVPIHRQGVKGSPTPSAFLVQHQYKMITLCLPPPTLPASSNWWKIIVTGPLGKPKGPGKVQWGKRMCRLTHHI